MRTVPCVQRLLEAAVVAAVAGSVAVSIAPAQIMGQSGAATEIPAEVLAYPDLILTNGKVLTVDKDFSVQQALAIRDGKVLATGTNRAIERLMGPKTQRIDLAGKTVVPGLIDTHIHLQDIGISQSAKQIAAIEPKFRDYLNSAGGLPPKEGDEMAGGIMTAGGATLEAGSITEFLQGIKTVVDSRKPGSWVLVKVGSPELKMPFWDKIRRRDLDAVAPNHLLVVSSAGQTVNTKVVEAIKAFYGFMPEEFELDETGLLNGRIDVTLVRSLIGDLMIEKPLESLYPAFRKTMLKWAGYGVTTWATSLTPFTYQPLYREMDRRGEMPIRFAYGHSMGVNVFPHAGDFYRRLGDVEGMGSDWFWSAGASVVHVDLAPCTTVKPGSQPCMIAKRDDVKRRALFEAVKYGNRIVETHVSGDQAADQFLDVIEEASTAAGMTPAQIRAKVHALDHCNLNPRPDQIERGKKLGVMWACRPVSIERAADFAAEYGVEPTHRWMLPVGGILRAGGRASAHLDTGGEVPNETYFASLEPLLTRKDSKGRVWGRDEAIDRKDALRMYTIWAAEYVGRSDRLGSLEPGKLADLVVLNRDYMTTPPEEFSEIRPVLTIVGGKTVYRRETTSQP